MSKYTLFQDTKKCIGCHACEVACKASKALPEGPKPCQVVEVGPVMVNGLPRASYVFMPCFHCESPWCVAACPTGAMQRRKQDGIVYVKAELCVGCKSCISACPWGAPQWNQETGKMVKCDYCMDRLDEGQKPACVTVCTTRCLHWSSAKAAPANLRRERYAKAMATPEQDFLEKGGS